MTVDHPEGWAEYADDDPTFVKQVYDERSDNLRDALDVLAAAAPNRLTYREVEEELDWPRGKLRSVFGGYAQWSSRHADGRRAWHICPEYRSSSGEWECWMSEDQARVLRA